MVLHIQGFRVKRKLSYEEQYLHVGNGAQAAVEAIGVFNLVLPFGLVLSLNNCHYAPSIVRGGVSFSCLLDLRFVHTVTSNGISVSLNDVLGHLGHMSRKGASYFLTFTDDFSRYGNKIKALRSDRGGEYLSQDFKDYLESAVRILNMVPTKKVDKTPYEIWHGKVPNLSYLKVWGCEAYVKHDSADKLQQRSVKCIFSSEIPVVNDILGLIRIIGRRSERTTRAPNRLCLNMEVEDDVVGDLREPANYKAAMLDPDKTLPPNAKIVRCNGTIQEKLTWMQTLELLGFSIAIAAYYDYEIWQMDVKTAFLNGRLDEDIYMEQPEGYVNPKYPNRVCKLQRSIYGLKQASRQWNKRFDEEIKKFGFTQNRDEPCVYRKASGSNVVFLILYVDDILIMGNNIPRLKEVKDYLGKCFSMKDLGEAAYILGIKIYRDRSKRLIGLSQSAYIDKILKKFNMHNSKKGYLPMEVKHELSNEMCASTPEEVAYMKKVPYASAVGSIMYAVRCTRPDVAFAQNLVSRYQQNPGKLHWVAVKHILKYLRNTRDMFLVYGGKPDTELNVTGFCDASWQCDKDDTKSQTGYVFVVNGGAVDWKSKKQTTIAMSATQAEYMAASEAAMEAVWIRKFVGDLGVMPSIKEPINVYCDNSAAITFANDSGIMKGARHFLRRYHFVREQVESGEIKILKVHTDDNLADPFTKALPRGKVTDHANGIGLQLASSFMHTCD
ncbi:retrotransposon protein, putative, ty1-copia subclass [Tanacetum coccineum]